eukprot:scaffold20556_cov34-Tisochrysis_lutea.AAC.1
MASGLPQRHCKAQPQLSRLIGTVSHRPTAKHWLPASRQHIKSFRTGCYDCGVLGMLRSTHVASSCACLCGVKRPQGRAPWASSRLPQHLRFQRCVLPACPSEPARAGS